MALAASQLMAQASALQLKAQILLTSNIEIITANAVQRYSANTGIITIMNHGDSELWESLLEGFFLEGFLNLAFQLRGFQLNNPFINKFPSIHVKGAHT
jgi:hypothetical protein